MKERIYLSPPHMSGFEQQYIDEAFKTNWISPLGPNVDAFENELSKKVGAKAALALSSGTSAIHLALRYLGAKPGAIVFSSSLTFAGSCNPILYQGAEPVFIDSDENSWNMSPKVLEGAFQDYLKKGRLPVAVIVTNIYGQSADYDEIISICGNYKVPIIEDAAESLGALYKGRQSGTFGKFGIYSFNGNKILTTSGGGMLVSDDEEAIEKCRFWATQARDKARHYQHSEYGYNYRMSNILAGIGRGQLKVLDERVKRKKEIYEYYKENFSDVDLLKMMPIYEKGNPNYWLSVVTIENNNKVEPVEIIEALENLNIETRPVWKPMHMQPLYSRFDYFTDPLNENISEKLYKKGICLPSGTSITKTQQDNIISVLKDLIK